MADSELGFCAISNCISECYVAVVVRATPKGSGASGDGVGADPTMNNDTESDYSVRVECRFSRTKSIYIWTLEIDWTALGNLF